MKCNHAKTAAVFAIAGGIILMIGIFVSMMSYRGIRAEPYSFTNHFISELGWRKSAPSAVYFNLSLVISNFFCIPMIYALGRHIRTRLGYVAMFCGICMLFAGASVGLLPADDLKPHLVAAVCFFSMYLFTMVLFTVAFAPTWNKTPSIPMVVVGIICCVVAVTFLAFPKHSLVSAIQDLRHFQRPQIWWIAILEWSIPVSGYLWTLTAMLVLNFNEITQAKTRDSRWLANKGMNDTR